MLLARPSVASANGDQLAQPAVAARLPVRLPAQHHVERATMCSRAVMLLVHVRRSESRPVRRGRRGGRSRPPVAPLVLFASPCSRPRLDDLCPLPRATDNEQGWYSRGWVLAEPCSCERARRAAL